MIPEKLKREMFGDAYYLVCARSNKECEGRITYEHALMYAGKQIQEKWAIIPLCYFHHLGPGLNKRVNQIIAFGRATLQDLKKYPRIKIPCINLK